MGRYITLNVDAEIDMGDIEDEMLVEEIKRRKKQNEWDIDNKTEYGLGQLEYDLPIENLDFKMKLDVFMENWERFRFTDINDFFTK